MKRDVVMRGSRQSVTALCYQGSGGVMPWPRSDGLLLWECMLGFLCWAGSV